jgi:hypothetical protein
MVLFFYFHDPEKSILFPKCPLYVWTGLYCPGCGSQRAFHSFLHFRFLDVMHYNFLLYPAGVFILYHMLRPGLNKFFRLKLPDFLYRKNTPWIILVIVVIFWILRNIPVAPFTWLAPV